MVELSKVYANRRVLVTGHTGFKGSWLALWLHTMGADVSGIALDPHTEPNLYEATQLSENIRDVRLDIRDAAALAEKLRDLQPDIVFHLAAQPIVRTAYQAARETFETNTMGSVNVCEAVCQTASVKAFVHVSTDKCYEPTGCQDGYRETDPLGGPDPYSASKAAAEVCFSAYCRSFFIPGGRTHAASGRAGNVIGGGDWATDRIVPDIARALKDDGRVAIRNPGAVRPWQHVLDALSGYLQIGAALLEENGAGDGAWNFGPPPESFKTVRELAVAFLHAWGTGTDRWDNSQETDAPHEAEVLVLNSNKAREQLGWKSVWGFEAAVKRTSKWYRSFYNGEDARDLCLADLHDYVASRESEAGDG